MCLTYLVKETFQELKNPIISKCPATKAQGSWLPSEESSGLSWALLTALPSQVPCLDILTHYRPESDLPALFHLTHRTSCISIFLHEETGSERLR